MPGLKRLGLLILVLLGPGFLIYIFAKTLSNKFIELPYIGEHTIVSEGGNTDTIFYQVPAFEFKTVNGGIVNEKTTENTFLVFTTIQNDCPTPEQCGLYMYHINELFYSKIADNKDNYDNVKIYSILTDEHGESLTEPSEKLLEAMTSINVDTSIWQILIGDPAQVFDFKFNGDAFMELPASPSNFEIGSKAFVSSLVLVDKDKHIRGFTGAKRDSDIRNFFDLLKILKKVEFDEERNNH